jgi:Subtilase family
LPASISAKSPGSCGELAPAMTVSHACTERLSPVSCQPVGGSPAPGICPGCRLFLRDVKGLPASESNLGDSIGRRGLRAPGQNITSLGTNGKPLTFNGTSAAAPFVTGTTALLWSEFPAAGAAGVKLAITRCLRKRRNARVPPLLDA